MLPSVLTTQLRESLLDYLRTALSISDPDLEDALFDFLASDRGLFQGPLIDLKLPFRKALENERIPLEIAPSFRPYAHQLKAFERLHSSQQHQPQHTLVTTGTGSGKTECFLYPIVDHCYRHRDTLGIKAIILYPMNALASDQARRIAHLLASDPRLTGEADGLRPIRGGLYVGGIGSVTLATADALIDDRDILRQAPPDILLTNYRMLDFLLLRPEDRKLWQHNTPNTLRYLVLDELHTYDGAQGTDVACLIRRLKARLSTPPGVLCSVGTSATIGANERDAVALARFASTIFGERFGRDSIIREERYDADSALGHHIEPLALPPLTRQTFELLDPLLSEDNADYLERQIRAWFPNSSTPSPVELGERLRKHAFLRILLRALDGKQRALPELDRELRRQIPELQGESRQRRWALLQSFLALVSYARIRDGRRELPFLSLQMQLWVRELRRMVRKVNPTPELAWEDEVEGDEQNAWLPLVTCRDCGASGFGARRPLQSSTLAREPRSIGEAFLNRSREACFVQLPRSHPGPGPGPGPRTSTPSTGHLFTTYLDPQTLDIYEESKRPPNTELLPVVLDQTLSEGEYQRFLGRCPSCGTDDALRMLGSRAATLSSVLITQLFGSSFNQDPKLLAFTDSVQDASHRAGFFGARTYRFNLRSAIQSAIEAQNGRVALHEVAEAMLEHWGKSTPAAQLVATLMPQDLRDLPHYREFVGRQGKSIPPDLRRDLVSRLGWEVTSELGHYAPIGRSLERSACATLAFDEPALAQAATTFHLDLLEASPVLFHRKPDEAQCQHFMDGLVQRLRHKGAIHHPLLSNYIAANGARFMLRKRKTPLFPPFGRRSRLPRLVVLQRKHNSLETLLSPPNVDTWYRDWARRVLRCDPRDGGINDLYRKALSRLVSEGLMKGWQTRGDHNAYALVPEKLFATTALRVLCCLECGHDVTLPIDMAQRWQGRTCTHYRCSGRLEPTPQSPPDYYNRLYRSGRLDRIFTAEHTGLLARREREDLEERFQKHDTPESPNLVVCTPTLEMGIDIGDLSAVMLCSVPRTVASYQQRVGRAGRKTGNALNLTVVEPQPHALYFFAEPLEMSAGAVQPPGCFLDAPEILKRQMVAFALDHWTLHDPGFDSLPRDASALTTRMGQAVLPERFIAHIDAHRAPIVEAFLHLFGEHLSPENTAILRDFGEQRGLDRLISDAVDVAVDELEQLRSQVSYLTGRIKRLEAKVASDPTLQEELDAAIEGKQVASRLSEERGGRYILNVLTDSAALPNYAFPESGVVLRSVIRTQVNEHGRGKYRAAEYLRPGPLALRELAPFNAFYAKGHKVVVDQIDVGSPDRSHIERWRFCERCHHHERDSGEEPGPSCPRCHDVGWSDSGQRRALLRFRRAQAYADIVDAVISDSDEDRERRSYQTTTLIDVRPEHWAGAEVLPDLPFGFELLKNLEIRELNCGLRDSFQQNLKMAGHAVPADGFHVCRGCGKVQHKKHKSVFGADFIHAPSCKLRNQGEKAFEDLYLYRSLRSEAIRLLLPVAVEKVEAHRASFQAALSLGLRKKYGGDPDHIGITFMSEPVEDNDRMRRNFLVLYDRIPGGTGYLSDLAQRTTLLEVLERAQEALLSCRCRTDSLRDGCHRCLYAFQPSRDIPHISSKRARGILHSILEAPEKFETRDTLSMVSVDTRLESELEERFVAALELWVRGLAELSRVRGEAAETWGFERTSLLGETVYRLRLGPHTWTLTPQVSLGPADGVSVLCRPDFLLRCTSGPDVSLPIAVFCDGWRYHALPSEGEGRIWDDVHKRHAILDSGQYLIWNLAWDDVARALEPDAKHRDLRHAFFAELKHDALRAFSVLKSSCFEQLTEYLLRPEPEAWRKAVGQALLIHVMTRIQTPPVSFLTAQAASALREDIIGKPTLFLGQQREHGPQPPQDLSVQLEDSASVVLVEGPLEAFEREDLSRIAMWFRLFDDAEMRGNEKRLRPTWWRMLQCWNLVQFLDNVHMVTSESITRGAWEARSERIKERIVKDDRADDARVRQRDVLLEYVMPECEPLIEAITQAEDVPMPEIDDLGFALKDGTGRMSNVLSEIAWPELKVAVLLEEHQSTVPGWEAAGWTVFLASKEAGVVVEALRACVGAGS